MLNLWNFQTFKTYLKLIFVTLRWKKSHIDGIETITTGLGRPFYEARSTYVLILGGQKLSYN